MLNAQTLIELPRQVALAVSPCGAWAAVGQQRLHKDGTKYTNTLVRLDLATGATAALTRGDTDHSPAFLWDGRLAFLSNRGESDEKNFTQVFVFPDGVGEPQAATSEALGVKGFVAAESADVLVCTVGHLPGVALDKQRETHKERGEKGTTALVYDRGPVRYWDHWLPMTHTHVVAYLAGQRRDLTPQAGRELEQTSISVSPNGEWVTWLERHTGPDRNHDHTLVLHHLASGDTRRLFAQAHVTLGGICWAPDSASFAYLRHIRVAGVHGADELHRYDVVSGHDAHLLTGVEHWLAPVRWLDNDRLLLSGEADTSTAVFVLETASSRLWRVTSAAAGGAHRHLCVHGGMLYGLRSRITHPPEPFRCELAPDAMPELVATLSPFELPDDLEITDHRADSTDGTAVQFFTVERRSLNADQALMWIHGGPVGQWGDDWHWRWNPIVGANLGWKMVLPNPRGSTGFGQKFVDDIFGNTWGGQCFEDLMVVADTVCAMPGVDPAKFCAMGGSFGGYMTNWIGTQTDRFRRLVTHAGLFDLAMFHGVTDMPAWWAHAFNVDPYRDRKAFDVYSPVRHVAGWKSPTLVIHGDLDYRVPVGEALALFDALQHLGVESRLLIFPDENHWILKPRNIVAWYEEVFRFLE